ncbi:MAG: glycosyltransferase [Eubacteriales bacterium]|nr:glycosyltransferase [Eubacteriales bacterium]
MKISVVCVYNDEKAFQEQLKTSLENQLVEYELISICNKDKTFSSASSALNFGAGQATGDVLIFSHQDIFIKGSDQLELLARAIQEAPEYSVVGTQGIVDKSKCDVTNITAGQDYNSSEIHNYEYKLYEVSTFDEGLFGMKKSTWERHKFDEKICDNWHLYAIEQCLYARSHAGRVYVYPIQFHHYSMGTISLSYMNTLKELCRIYRKDFKYIWTTCYKVRTNPIYINILVKIWLLNRIIRGRSY